MPPRPHELAAGPCIAAPMPSPPRRLATGATVTVVHTAHLASETRRGVRELVDRAFAGEFSVDDWDHALGGLHALVHDGGDLVAHGAVVARRMLHGGRTLRIGYVEAVAVDPDQRRRGHASAVMAALEEVVRSAYDAGALGATDDGALLYAARGWQRWQGATWALTPSGRVRTPEDDDAVFVLPVVTDLDLGGELTCDWRDGDLW